MVINNSRPNYLPEKKRYIKYIFYRSCIANCILYYSTKSLMRQITYRYLKKAIRILLLQPYYSNIVLTYKMSDTNLENLKVQTRSTYRVIHCVWDFRIVSYMVGPFSSKLVSIFRWRRLLKKYVSCLATVVGDYSNTKKTNFYFSFNC